MKVLFDLSVCQPNAGSKFHGGGIYGCIIFRKLIQICPNQVKAYYFYSRFLDPSILDVIREYNIKTYDGDSLSIEDAFRQSHADKIYSPLYSSKHDVLINSGVHYMVTVHGLRSLEMLTDSTESRYSVSYRSWLKAKIKGSFFSSFIYKKYYNQYKKIFDAKNVHVITVSNHSKYSIKCHFPQININQIEVFYSPSTTIDNYIDYSIKGCDKYYLIISANRWIKNAARAISAFDLLFDLKPELLGDVKVLGLNKNSWVYKGIKHKDKFEILGYQSQEDLEKLYSGAYAFIYPTLNEGFGYPPLEAMKYGIPVVSSPFSSIPEICGDAVLYSNPYSVEEIANRILQLEEEETYKKYQQAGVKRYKLIKTKQDQDLEKLCKLIIGS